MFSPVATFSSQTAAEEFRHRLEREGIPSETGVGLVLHEGVAVGVPAEMDEVAIDYLVEWYGTPTGFGTDEACPSCELRVAEATGEPGFEWRCLRCGQVWGSRGQRLP
jgi:hypothetical protein